MFIARCRLGRDRALLVGVEMEVSRSDEEEREGGADEGRDSGNQEDPIQSGEERLSGGIGQERLRLRRCRRDRRLGVPEETAGASSPACPCSAGGPLASRSPSLDSTRPWKTAPSAAIPTATPTWRKVLLIAAPVAAFAAGTTPIAASETVGLTRPIPAPMRSIPEKSRPLGVGVQATRDEAGSRHSEADADQRPQRNPFREPGRKRREDEGHGRDREQPESRLEREWPRTFWR